MERYNKAIKDFYEIKNTYDSSIIQKKRKILEHDALTNAEKKNKIQQLTSKCASCGRNVGMIFSIKNNELRAVCGDASNPCKLNIHIKKGRVINIENTLDILKKGVDEDVEKLIKTKLDLLFNYTDEDSALDNFSNEKDQYTESMKIYNEYKSLLNNTKNNKEKKQLLKEHLSEVEKTIKTIKDETSEFEKTENIKHIHGVSELYKSVIYPENDIIRNIKNSSVRIEEEYNHETKMIEKVLHKESYTYKDLETYVEKPQVISFKI